MNVTSHSRKTKISSSNVPVILVVEDDPDNLLLLCHTLIFLKHNFITATTGKKAYNLVMEYEIDLMLLDLKLPDINGFELISSLKEDKLTQKIPIIVLSALVRTQDRERAIKAGCNEYIIKPYLIEDLDSKIRRYLPGSFLNCKPMILKRSLMPSVSIDNSDDYIKAESGGK
ncbi:MAG: response regulator [Pleurocapsa sp.]